MAANQAQRDVLEQAAHEGGGSSFLDINPVDQTSADIKARVLNRDQSLDQQESGVLAKVLSDSELLELRGELLAAFSSNRSPA